MSKRDELLELINGAGEWYSPKELAAESGISSAAELLRELLAAGQIQGMKPAPGSGTGVHVIYGPLGKAAPEGATPLPGNQPRTRVKARRQPAKLKGSRAEAKARKLGKRRAKRHHKPSQRVAITERGKALLAKADTSTLTPAPSPGVDSALLPRPPRVALTSDGALVDLTSGLEIPPAISREILALVRRLDAHAIHADTPA